MALGRLAIAPDTSADLALGKIGRAPPHQLALLDIESAQPAHHFIEAIERGRRRLNAQNDLLVGIALPRGG